MRMLMSAFNPNLPQQSPRPGAPAGGVRGSYAESYCIAYDDYSARKSRKIGLFTGFVGGLVPTGRLNAAIGWSIRHISRRPKVCLCGLRMS